MKVLYVLVIIYLLLLNIKIKANGVHNVSLDTEIMVLSSMMVGIQAISGLGVGVDQQFNSCSMLIYFFAKQLTEIYNKIHYIVRSVELHRTNERMNAWYTELL